MDTTGSDLIVAETIGLSIVFLFTLPAGITVVRTSKRWKSITLRYEDKDGIASLESQAAFSTKIPKICLCIFATLGLFTFVLRTLQLGIAQYSVEQAITSGLAWVCPLFFNPRTSANQVRLYLLSRFFQYVIRKIQLPATTKAFALQHHVSHAFLYYIFRMERLLRKNNGLGLPRFRSFNCVFSLPLGLEEFCCRESPRFLPRAFLSHRNKAAPLSRDIHFLGAKASLRSPKGKRLWIWKIYLRWTIRLGLRTLPNNGEIEPIPESYYLLY